MNRKVDISHRTIVFTTVFLLALWIIYQILDVILLIFVAVIFMSAIAPLVDRLISYKVPKIVAILLVYLLVIIVLGVILAAGIKPVVDQTSQLSQRLAENSNRLFQFGFVDPSILKQELTNASHNLITYTLDAFRGIVALLSVIVMSIYLLLDRQAMEDYLSSFFLHRQQKVKKLMIKIENKLGAWLRGQLMLSIIIGVATYIGLLALGIEFALPLAIVAGLFEVVPVIGPIVSAIPAILIALTVSPLLALGIAVFYLVVQQLESHLIVPQVMKHAVGLNPLLVIISISIGGKLLGITGALLAVPIAVVIQVVIEEVLSDEELFSQR